MNIGKPGKFKSSFTLVFIVIAIVLCFAAFGSQNANAQICPPDKQVSEGLFEGFGFFRGGLVPCGRQCNDPWTANDETATCTLCHFIVLFHNIYTFLIALLIIVALVFLTIGGVAYIVSSGNSNLKSFAKGIITKTLTGFALFLLSWLIVFAILFFLSVNYDSLGTGGGSGWYQFHCSTQSAFDPPP